MPSRATLLLGLLAALCLACGAENGSDEEPLPDVAAPREVGGTYQVSGVTEELESGEQRKISGTVILTPVPGGYRSSFELATVMPGPDGPHHTEVIGTGDGRIDSTGVLSGTARTQLVIGAVAGVPTQFPFIPRYVGPRIVSETLTRFADDGTIEIEIETRADAGETYRPTRTTLTGTMIPGSETPGGAVAR